MNLRQNHITYPIWTRDKKFATKKNRDFGICGTITMFNISVIEFYREIENMELKNQRKNG